MVIHLNGVLRRIKWRYEVEAFQDLSSDLFLHDETPLNRLRRFEKRRILVISPFILYHFYILFP